MNYCPYCFEKVEGDFCGSCGANLRYQAGETQLAPGSLLSGNGHHYLIGAARGQGGFGITYAARDQGEGKRVAVKEYFPIRCAIRGADGIVLPKSGMEAEFQKGFDNFCKEAGRLVGIQPLDSIVNMYDNILLNGTAYLIMEYIDGVPLHQKVSQTGGRIPAQELLPKLLPLLRDLDSLHAQGLLHRDISPDNILWQDSGKLKLIDFGSSRLMEGDRSMTVMLKQGFSPVEQYLTHGQGPWTDVYGMGATVYYCLTGIILPSALERLEQEDLKLPTEMGAAISPEEEQALLKAIAVQPKNRFQSMRAFCGALFPDNDMETAYTQERFHWTLPAQWRETQGFGQADAVEEKTDFSDGQEAAKKNKTWLAGLGVGVAILAGILWIVWIFGKLI